MTKSTTKKKKLKKEKEFLNKKNYSEKKKQKQNSDCTLDCAMTVMKHAVSVTQVCLYLSKLC